MLLMNRNSGFSIDCCPNPNPSLVLRTSNACPSGTGTVRVARGGLVRRIVNSPYGRRIPWANISLVETRQNAQEDGSWRCAVYLYWQAHAKAAALRHYSIDTSRPTEPQGDCSDLTRQIAQLIHAYSPNLGKARD